MTDVVRQKDEQFQYVLSLIRNGPLTNEKYKRIYIRLNEAIHLVTQ